MTKATLTTHGSSREGLPASNPPLESHHGATKTPDALLMVVIGAGCLGAGAVLPIAFNASLNIINYLATPVIALGIAITLCALPPGRWRRHNLFARLIVATATFAAVTAANPGAHVHAVSQDLWGLSNDTNKRPTTHLGVGAQGDQEFSVRRNVSG